MSAISRRKACAGLALALFSAPSAAFAGSYLNRAGLLIRQGLSDANYLRARVYDKELGRIIHDLARARLSAASRMSVPKEVVQAHPHVLLVLENLERGAEAAVDGKVERFLVYHQRALDEERTLRNVLKQLGWSLPDK